MNRAARATQNRLWVSGGLSVASLNAIFCCPCPPHTYGSHTHKHTVSDSATPIELTIRGARERLTEIDTHPLAIYLVGGSKNRYTTKVVSLAKFLLAFSTTIRASV